MGDDDPGLEALLEFLRASHGFDFTGYKRTTLARRVRHRIDLIGVAGYEAYLDHLQVHPEEFATLFDTILINVTAFFRDPVAWAALGQSVLPGLLEHKRGRDPVRVWSAGCATGEEAYTVAIACAEAIGLQRFREQVKIFATDLDEGALQVARHGSYPLRDLADVEPRLVEKYFEVQGSSATFRGDLRRCVIFGRHDLVQDAPISRLDLLICRNTLMYFTAEAQARIIARLHYALNDDGFLFLGKAEMLLSHADLFAPVDSRSRVFTKVAKGNLRERLMVLAETGSYADAGGELSAQLRLRDASIDAAPTAQVVIDAAGTVVVANQQARSLLDISAADVGARFQDLAVASGPVELRSLIADAQARQRPVTVRDVEVPSADPPGLGSDARLMDIEVIPLRDTEGGALGTSLSFTDVTGSHQLQSELARSRQDLETAYEELQSANEELETTNEELQSTVEELETTNEELQSANEELETMNEELQSTNGELQTINSELRERTEELDRVNVFMESVLTSLRLGVVVVDPELRVQIWNGGSVELWGLRPDEVIGSSFLGLDIGLPVDELEAALRGCIEGRSDYEERVVGAHNRRGRAMTCRISCTPLVARGRGRRGVVLLMEDVAARDPAEASLS